MVQSPLSDLWRRASDSSDQLFIVDRLNRITFSEAASRIDRVAAFLKLNGIRRGDRACVLTQKGYLQVIAQLGAMLSGAVVVPISELLKPEQVQHIVRDCEPKVVIVDADKKERLGASTEDLLILSSENDSGITLERVIEENLSQELSCWPTQIGGDDDAAIIYSSGSTGLPKGIVLSHQNLWDGARLVCSYLDLTSQDKLAQVLSLNFDYGLNQVFCGLHAGAEIHFTAFHFPKDLFAFIRSNEITTLALMPIFLNRIFDARYFTRAFVQNIASLKRITTSGGRVSRDIINSITDVLPDTDLYLMYGLTEAFRSTFLHPSQIRHRPESIGKAIPEVEIMVVNEKNQKCPVNEPGELVHRGGVIAKGYWNNAEATWNRFRAWKDENDQVETVVYSGDIVREDEEGYLYFIGRKDNMIKTSGHRVSPEEIEKVAETIEGIRYAVAFGKEHDILGEEIILVCIRSSKTVPISVQDVEIFLREKIADYMVPQRILFQDHYGVTAANQGKIDRNAIRSFAIKKYLDT